MEHPLHPHGDLQNVAPVEHHSQPLQHSPRVLFATTILNILLSLGLVVVGLWLALRHHINCLKFLEIPIIFIGLALLVSSIVATVAIKRHRTFLIGAYLVLLFFLLLLLFAFTLFAFYVTRGGGGHLVPATSYQEYKLGDYAQWLQNEVTNPNKWLSLRECIKDMQVCKILDKQYPTLHDFNDAILSPIQSGCCKPPTSCGFTFGSPTQWVSATTRGASTDCGTWNNKGLCYSCEACKAGLLENVRKDWRKAAKVCLAILILLIVVYLIAWFTFLKGFFKRHHGFSRPKDSAPSTFGNEEM